MPEETLIVHHPENQWLPSDLHDKRWYDLTDPTMLEEGNWVFDPASHAHYAGLVLFHNIARSVVNVRWYKRAGELTMEDLVTGTRLTKLWWLDPMLSFEE